MEVTIYFFLTIVLSMLTTAMYFVSTKGTVDHIWIWWALSVEALFSEQMIAHFSFIQERPKTFLYLEDMILQIYL